MIILLMFGKRCKTCLITECFCHFLYYEICFPLYHTASHLECEKMQPGPIITERDTNYRQFMHATRVTSNWIITKIPDATCDSLSLSCVLLNVLITLRHSVAVSWLGIWAQEKWVVSMKVADGHFNLLHRFVWLGLGWHTLSPRELIYVRDTDVRGYRYAPV